MKLTHIDTDAICEKLPEVTNSKIFELRKFAKTGLFSQQLFGPVKSYHCACTKFSYKGPRYDKVACPVCGVEITTSNVRKKRYGKIHLPFKILSPIFYHLVCGRRTSVKKIINDLIYYRCEYYYDEKGDLKKFNIEEDTRDENVKYLKGLDGAVIYIETLIEEEIKQAEDNGTEPRPELLFVKANFDKIKIENFLVIPPEFRPCSKLNNNSYVTDDINKQYQEILKISTEVKCIPYVLQEHDDVYITNFRYIQKLVIEVYDYIMERMSKKTGLIRSNILGKRVDFSGRAVISPNPELKLNQCGLPYWMVLELFKPNLITYFVNRRLCKRYNQAIKLIDESIKNHDAKYLPYVEEFVKDKMCIINRQPSLHRLSVLGFNIRVHLGNTIQIHPMICPPLNADFDGDQVAVYVPTSQEGYDDIRKHMGIWENMVSPTDAESVPRPNQDIILGIYAATKE
jgi:DNA-directed RNA polymerase subunit beta'